MQRNTGLSRTTPLRPGKDYTGLKRASLTVVRDIGSAPATKRAKRDTIPPDVRRLVAARDMGLCVHCAQPAEHQHHRRVKGMGGDTRAHTDCPCNLVSLCSADHELAHRDRALALAEGLIIPRATPLPRLLPVLVHGVGSGTRAWPTCTGEWIDFEPDGGSAA